MVFASFMIHIIGKLEPILLFKVSHQIENIFSADGITYSFGVFLVELISVFEVDRGVISFIPSILVGVTLGSGQLVILRQNDGQIS